MLELSSEIRKIKSLSMKVHQTKELGWHPGNIWSNINGLIKLISKNYFYWRICWRPLSLEIGNKEIEIIEAFVVKTLGKGFELSL